MYWLTNPTSIKLIGLVLGNLIICRWLTTQLVLNGYVSYGTVQFNKTVLLWFIPVFGVCGLSALYMVHLMKKFFKWLFMAHHKPVVYQAEVKEVKKRAPRKPKQPAVDINKLTEDELVKRANEIHLKRALQKVADNKKKFATKKRKLVKL